MIRSLLLALALSGVASVGLAADQPAADPFATPPAPTVAPAPAPAPAAAPAVPSAAPIAPPTAPRPAVAAPVSPPCKPRRVFSTSPTLVPAKCDAQGRLVCRQFGYGPRNVTIARITEKDGATQEITEVRQVGYGPMVYDIVYEAKDLYLFSLDGNPIDPQMLPSRLSRLTPVLIVQHQCAPAFSDSDVERGGSLLDAFRDDVVVIGVPYGVESATRERPTKGVPPSPPRPIRVRMDDQGRLVFHPLDLGLSFVFPSSPAAGAPVKGRVVAPPRPVAVKAVAGGCNRFALSPELVSVFDSNGEPVDEKTLPQVLAKETTALVCELAKACAPAAYSGATSAPSQPPTPFEPFYLRAMKPGTLLFVLPFSLNAAPAAPPAPKPQVKAAPRATAATVPASAAPPAPAPAK